MNWQKYKITSFDNPKNESGKSIETKYRKLDYVENGEVLIYYQKNGWFTVKYLKNGEKRYF